MKKIAVVSVACALFLSAASPGFAATGQPVRLELRAGYGQQYTNDRRPHDFNMLLLLPSASVPLCETGEAAPGFLEGRFEWAPEIFLAMFTRPYHRGLVGITPIQFRYVFQPDWKLRPYVFAGVGVLHANVNRRETRSDWNFNPQGGGGIYYDLSGSASLILEYRHIHISNAGLHEDNAGINSHNVLVGVSLKK